MDHKHYDSPLQYLRQNLLLLFSTGAALCLFLTISKLAFLLCAAIFAAVAFSAWILGPGNGRQPAGAFLLAAVLDGVGAVTFLDTWTNSYMAGVILDRLPGFFRSAVPVVCAAGVLAAFYAFYRLSGWMIRVIRQFFGDTATGSCLKENWFFPLSAAAFFLLQSPLNRESLCAAAAAIAIAAVIAIHIPALGKHCRQNHRAMNLLISLSTLGICKFRMDQVVSSPVTLILAALAVPFVFVCLSCFFHSLGNLLDRNGVFRDMGRREILLYLLLWVVLLLLTGWVFLNTGIFALETDPYDVIYTGDFPLLVNENACLDLTHLENDLRQPLFAVFSAPFTAIFYLLSSLCSAAPRLHALLMNIPQIGILLLAHYLLALMLGLSGTKRMLFVLLLSCTYPTILFSLMMEQYVFTYFYVILFFFSLCRNGHGAVLPCLGSGGTLLTGVILLPLVSRHPPVRQFRAWFRDLLDHAMGFVLVLLAFSRADIIFNIASNVEKLTAFSGAKITLTDKLLQYTAFVSGCFVSPAAVIADNPWGRISWQLVPAESVHTGGILILVLCAVSLFLNRKQTVTRVCGGWILFSFAVLILLGWGTQENGLILYALYFGWAFWVLLYQLADRLCGILHQPRLLFLLTAGGTAALLAVNLPAAARLVSFLLTHYPI
ncbi:MAG: hypothetical protein IJE81_05630 [Oscillospiraceae bacterium]|nr:hypothetical protein [Oscillospiraceae bacterium]